MASQAAKLTVALLARLPFDGYFGVADRDHAEQQCAAQSAGQVLAVKS